jgi:hypothetical protein
VISPVIFAANSRNLPGFGPFSFTAMVRLDAPAPAGFPAWLALTDGTMGSNFCLLRVEEMTF